MVRQTPDFVLFDVDFVRVLVEQVVLGLVVAYLVGRGLGVSLLAGFRREICLVIAKIGVVALFTVVVF
jgi:hypothetical protein